MTPLNKALKENRQSFIDILNQCDGHEFDIKKSSKQIETVNDIMTVTFKYMGREIFSLARDTGSLDDEVHEEWHTDILDVEHYCDEWFADKNVVIPDKLKLETDYCAVI